MVGIKLLAEHLNLSMSTVSRALNGRHDSSLETRKRVLAAAAELGYVANQSGRSLRQGTTKAVGFMMELNADTASNSDNFFTGVFEGVKRSLAPHDLDLIVLPCSIHEDPVAYMRRIVGRRLVDGMIISATLRRDERVDILLASGIPFVALGRSDSGSGYTSIDLDFEGYVKSSVARLIEHGHRRIALAAHSSELNLRYVLTRSFRAAMKRHGLPAEAAIIVPTDSDEEGGYKLADTLLKMEPRPTGVILGYELMALGLYHRLAELGLLPGRDLAIIGLRESPQSRSLLPRLTCYRVDLVELGLALGAGLLVAMSANKAHSPSKRLNRLWPMGLVPGESG